MVCGGRQRQSGKIGVVTNSLRRSEVEYDSDLVACYHEEECSYMDRACEGHGGRQRQSGKISVIKNVFEYWMFILVPILLGNCLNRTSVIVAMVLF